MTSIIVADQLTKWFGPRLAVDHVSLQVEAGEVMGLLGPNGSGKTTILRILTGYLLPSSGTARIAGLDVVDSALAARAQVGYVPEDVPLYGWMRVREFLEFMARLKGLAGRAATRAVEAVIERLDLGSVRLLLSGPALLILDEPTNGLDPRQIIEMRGHIRTLAGERTVLVTSHILGEIERVADRAAILLEGRLLGVHALGSGDSGQRISMRVRGPYEAVRACLARVSGVQRVTAEPLPESDLTTCIVDCQGGSIAEELATAVGAAGFGLLDMTPTHRDLEALFLSLTSGSADVA